MKRLVVILLLVIPFLQASAQEQSFFTHTINRVDKQAGSTLPTMDYSEAYYQTIPKTFQTPAAWVDKPSLEITMGVTQKEFDVVLDSYDNGAKFEGSIKNITGDTIRLNFYRSQVLPSEAWSSTVCLNVCYSSTTDYLQLRDLVPIPPGESVPFIFHVYIEKDSNSNDTWKSYVRFVVANSHPGDTASFSFSAKANAASAVNDDQQISLASAKILSIYPSPLVGGSQINVTMQSPRETSFTYSIYDAYGREVAFGSPSYRLSAGSNTLEIKSLDAFATGSYALKINFQGGGSEARVFQVIN